jgi:F-type H+-transporting ATPase subunit epsilon
MFVDIVTPDQRLFSGEAVFVAAPAANGEIGLMELASPIMSTLKPGEVRIKAESNSEPRRFAVAGGYLESDGRKIVILANRALDVASIDVAFGRKRVDSYEKRLAEAAADDSRAAFYKEEIAWQQHLIKLGTK